MNSPFYQEQRTRFYSRVENFWPDLYGEEYALYDIHLTNEKDITKIRQATERIGKVFFKTAELLRNVPDETLIELGFPVDTLLFLRLRTLSVESVISRLDLVPAGDTYKCLEINSDTPTFIKELFHVNGMMCAEFGLTNPNHGMERRLGQAVREAILESARRLGEKEPVIVFTAHEDHAEDRNTALYLQGLAQLPSRFVPLHRLRIVRGEGLYDDGDKINVLYRQTFPVENLILDRDQDGHPIGLWLLELVASGKLAIINPPSAFLLQNKAVQVVIWGLHEQNNPFFTEEEHRWIGDYFLPTFLEPDPFIESGVSYVKKPVFGREGDTVEIFDENNKLAMKDSHESYANHLPVYQKAV